MPPLPAKTERIALTGGIASGKSLVGAYLQGRGIPVIDADDVVHQLLREDAEVKDKIRQTFGDSVFAADGSVDRKALGAQVFTDSTKRKLLESWLHPKTRERIEAFYGQHQGQPLAVSIIPLLFESELEDRYDTVWLLETPEELQVARLQQSRAMSRADAQARIASQMPLLEKRERAARHPNHAVIANTGTADALYTQVDALLSRFRLPA